MNKKIKAHQRLVEQVHSPGFRSVGLRGGDGSPLDPVLNVDLFHMSQPTFPPHPHAGFSAVTYLLPESEGSFRNRDSLGDQSTIGPGAIHWTQAGSGMMHEEIPEVAGRDCWGFQIFVNLSAADKASQPRAFHADASEIETVTVSEGSWVRVLAGSFSGARSPLTELLTPLLLLDVRLSAGASVTIPVDAGWNSFAISISGSGTAGHERRALSAPEVVLFETAGDGITLEAGAGGLRALVAAGRPIGEPVVFGGPFAMTTRSEIDAAFGRYRRGEMGHLSPSFEVDRS